MSSVTQESCGGKFSGELIAWNSHGSRIMKNWRIGRRSGGIVTPVATISDELSGDEQVSVSHLFAAAPDMYSALEAAYELATSERHDGDDVAAMIRQALSKAKGGAA